MTLFVSQSLSFFSSFFYSNQIVEPQPIVYESGAMQLIVPEYSLGEGSLKIQPSKPTRHFTDWKINHKLEAYTLIQKVIQVWKEKGITDYLLFGHEDANSSTNFSYEIVPYPKTYWLVSRLWKQFKVLCNIIFGGSYTDAQKRNYQAKKFSHDLTLSENQKNQIHTVHQATDGKDAFCNPDVITKQLVFEGKKINVLYNYAPIAIGKEKLHFLMVPKEHRGTFADLTQDEYVEAASLSQKLVQYYKNKGFTIADLFNKAGKDAGQTVPHWHEHAVFVTNKTDEFFSKLKVLVKMLFFSSPIPPDELKKKVEALKIELAHPLS